MAIFSLSGKNVVLTGGGRGIGRGIALAMARAGARVLVTGRSAAPLDAVVEEIKGLGAEAHGIAADIMGMEGIAAVVEGARARFGTIDCWVNNAGGAGPADSGPLFDITVESWDRVVDLNLKWAFFAAQAAARTMTSGGSIINISSRSGSQPSPLSGPYGAAKAGIESLTATMALEWGHLGIRVNAIAPGVVLSESMAELLDDKARERQIETIPLRRLGEPEDIGHLAVYLASDEAAWVTGTVTQINGGSRIPIATLAYLRQVNRKLQDQAE